MAKGSYEQAVIITPNDGADLALTPTQAVYIGGAGTMTAVMEDGNTVLFTGLLAGVIYPFRVVRIHLTGTSATLIGALY